MSITETTSIVPSAIEEEEDLTILGAKPLPSDDFEIIRKIVIRTPKGSDTFWDDFYEAKIGGEIRLTKMYHKKSGGKKSWERDMTWLRDNVTSNMPKVYGYSGEATPFIVLKQSTFDIIVPVVTRSHISFLL